MFRCQGTRSVLTPPLSYYKLVCSVQAVVNIPQDAIGSLHNSGVISCTQVRDRSANGVRGLRFCAGMIQDKNANNNNLNNACKYVFNPRKSVSSLDFSLPLLGGNMNHYTNARIYSPKRFFCFGTETCTIPSSTHKLNLSAALSNALKENQADRTKREPTTEAQKELLSDSPQGGPDKPEPEEKQNKTQQLKKVFKEYGAVGVTFHVGISIISLGIFYIAVSSGINMTALLCKLGFSESLVQSKMATGTSTFVLAYAVHKLFAPFRISITLVSVPLIVRYLRKTGLFKAAPPRL